tara:strand:- start:1245 stop:1811 length:567 start_codon:yes stop_codon:yes gene_type:complete
MPRKSKRRTRRKRGGQIMSNQEKLALIDRLNKNSLSDNDKTNLYCSSPANAKLNKAIEGQVIDGVSMKDSPMRGATGDAQTLDGRERQCNETFAWNPGVIGMEDLYKELDITTPQAKYADMIDMFDNPGGEDDEDYYDELEGGRRKKRYSGGRWLFSHKSRKKKRKRTKKKRRRKKKKTRKRRRKRRR